MLYVQYFNSDNYQTYWFIMNRGRSFINERFRYYFIVIWTSLSRTDSEWRSTYSANWLSPPSSKKFPLVFVDRNENKRSLNRLRKRFYDHEYHQFR